MQSKIEIPAVVKPILGKLIGYAITASLAALFTWLATLGIPVELQKTQAEVRKSIEQLDNMRLQIESMNSTMDVMRIESKTKK